MIRLSVAGCELRPDTVRWCIGTLVECGQRRERHSGRALSVLGAIRAGSILSDLSDLSGVDLAIVACSRLLNESLTRLRWEAFVLPISTDQALAK